MLVNKNILNTNYVYYEIWLKTQGFRNTRPRTVTRFVGFKATALGSVACRVRV